MAKANKLTIEKLIAMKSKKDSFAFKDVTIASLGGQVTIKKCKYDVILKVMDSISKDDNTSNLIEAFKELIYKSTPIFSSEELLKAYDVTEPFDIVTEILELGEIITLGNEILSLYGLDKLGEDIKN